MSNKIDVAVLGLGGMGKTHVGAAKASPYVERVYGVDATPELTAMNANKQEVIPATEEEVLANPQIRLVYIATPNQFHVAQASAALRAGKAVLCEKPMGLNLSEAQELLKVQRETGGFLQIGFELHYSTLYMKVHDWLQQGLIGTPVNIQCRYYCCEFHRKGSWRSQHSGSFLIGEKLSHYLDLERWWFGRQVRTVYSASAPKVVEYFNHRDNHQIITKFDGGGVGTLNFIMYFAESYHADPLQEILSKQSEDGHFLQYHICGTKGGIETDVFKRRLRRWEYSYVEDGLESKIVEDIRWSPEEDNRWFHSTHTQNVRVAELVAKGLPPEVPATDAYETMKLCFGAELSEDTGSLISLEGDTPSPIA